MAGSRLRADAADKLSVCATADAWMEVDSAGDAKPAAEEPARDGEARAPGSWAEVAARAPTAAAPKDPFVDAMLAPSLTRTANNAATYAVSVCCHLSADNTL